MEAGGNDRLRAAAVALLARREHTAVELERKLTRRGHDAAAVRALVAELKRDGLQSDSRYLDVYLRSRRERGYGPLRIAGELIERGLDRARVQDALRLADDWADVARRQLQRRFGDGRPRDEREWARHCAFLQRRGFTGEQIHTAVERRGGGS